MIRKTVLSTVVAALLVASSENAPAQSVQPFPEFNAQAGLGIINILPAWTKATGAGVTVGVVDSGVRLSHREIRANLASTGHDFVNNDSVANDDSYDGHGTRLAGIIAAARDGAGIVGVAYDARILPVKVRGVLRKQQADLTAAGIDYAASQGASVINLSLPRDFDRGIANAVANAAQAGSIMVMAAGNTGGGGPLFPAFVASHPALQGRGIAVGSISPGGSISDFSNRAGSVMDFYLLAPGEQVLSTSNTSDSALAVGSGTSFAAPHVAGAAALLMQLFPNISPEVVVQILLETATDLGKPGTDEVYGRGLLNAGAAVSPQGDVAIPGGGSGSSSGGAAIAALAVGGAVGYALLNKSEKVDEALILDKYGRGYSMDLPKATTVRDGHYDLSTLMENLDRELNRLDVPISRDVTARLFYATPEPALYTTMDEDEWRKLSDEYSEDLALQLSGHVNRDLSYSFGYNLNPRRQFGNERELAGAGTALLSHQPFSSSYLGFASRGNIMNLNYNIGDSLDLRVGYTEMDDREEYGLDSRSAMLEGDLEASEDLTLGIQFGSLLEQGSLFGGSSSNAWGVDKTQTLSLGFSGAYDISTNTTLIGNYAIGYSDVEEMDNGLLKDFSSIRSNAYGLGVVNRDAFKHHDTFGVAWSQPLRATEGEATLDIPVGIDADDHIHRSSERIGLEPEGREQDFEAFYATDLGKHSRLSTHFLYQHEPQHNSEANDAISILLTMRSRF